MLETYERNNLKKWNITGSGYALYHDHSDDIIFLFDDADVRDEGVKFIPRLPYEQQEVMQGVRANKCNYWFDVLEAAPQAIDDGYDLMPARHRKASSRTEIILQVDCDQHVSVTDRYSRHGFNSDP